MISLFGYGKTTKALSQKLINYKIFDDKYSEITKIDKQTIYPSTFFDPNKSILEIPSPGIPPHNPTIKKAKNIISDYDYLLKDDTFSIWISGTNGKTTTTKMLTHLLEDKGAVMGGNVGTPLASLDESKPIFILETSSFTLHYTKKAKPNIYILLPISEDHTDWHGSFKKYKEAKLKPLKYLREGEAILLPEEFKDIPTNGYKITYRTSDDLANFFGIDKKNIKFKEPFLLDALLALGTTKILFDEINYDLINSFKLDPHRVEELKDALGRIWVNDSKGTNIHATIEAVKRYKKNKIHLILGGDDKGANLKELFAMLKKQDISIYAIGSNKDKISTLSKEANIDILKCINLEDAVEKIDKIMKKNDIALLSPAASSLDEYSSYKQRGDIFKDLVHKI